MQEYSKSVDVRGERAYHWAETGDIHDGCQMKLYQDGRAIIVAELFELQGKAMSELYCGSV